MKVYGSIAKVIYGLAVALFTVLCINETISCFRKYLTEPTAVNMVFVPFEKIPDITLSVCPPFFFKPDVIRKYGIQALSYFGGHWNTNETEDKDLRMVFEELSPDVSELVDFILIGSHRILPNDPGWTAKTDLQFGRCFALHINGFFNFSAGVYSNIILLARGSIYLGIQMKGQFYTTQSQQLIQRNKSTTFGLNLEFTKMLPMGNDTCSPKMDDGYDKCYIQTLKHDMEKSFNCSVPFPPFGPKIDEATPICRDLSTATKVATSLNYNLAQACSQPCRKVSVEWSSFQRPDSDNRTSARIALPEVVPYIFSYKHYTFVTMFAEIGGFVGILLGFSLLNLFNTLKGTFETFNNPKKGSCHELFSA